MFTIGAPAISDTDNFSDVSLDRDGASETTPTPTPVELYSPLAELDSMGNLPNIQGAPTLDLTQDQPHVDANLNPISAALAQLPNAASTVFSTFSNIIKGSGSHPRFEEQPQVPSMGPPQETFGYMYAPNSEAAAAPPPSFFSPTDESLFKKTTFEPMTNNTFRLGGNKKKTYAHIPGLSTNQQAQAAPQNFNSNSVMPPLPPQPAPVVETTAYHQDYQAPMMNAYVNQQQHREPEKTNKFSLTSLLPSQLLEKIPVTKGLFGPAEPTAYDNQQTHYNQDFSVMTSTFSEPQPTASGFFSPQAEVNGAQFTGVSQNNQNFAQPAPPPVNFFTPQQFNTSPFTHPRSTNQSESSSIGADANSPPEIPPPPMTITSTPQNAVFNQIHFNPNPFSSQPAQGEPPKIDAISADTNCAPPTFFNPMMASEMFKTSHVDDKPKNPYSSSRLSRGIGLYKTRPSPGEATVNGQQVVMPPMPAATSHFEPFAPAPIASVSNANVTQFPPSIATEVTHFPPSSSANVTQFPPTPIANPTQFPPSSIPNVSQFPPTSAGNAIQFSSANVSQIPSVSNAGATSFPPPAAPEMTRLAAESAFDMTDFPPPPPLSVDAPPVANVKPTPPTSNATLFSPSPVAQFPPMPDQQKIPSRPPSIPPLPAVSYGGNSPASFFQPQTEQNLKPPTSMQSTSSFFDSAPQVGHHFQEPGRKKSDLNVPDIPEQHSAVNFFQSPHTVNASEPSSVMNFFQPTPSAPEMPITKSDFETSSVNSYFSNDPSVDSQARDVKEETTASFNPNSSIDGIIHETSNELSDKLDSLSLMSENIGSTLSLFATSELDASLAQKPSSMNFESMIPKFLDTSDNPRATASPSMSRNYRPVYRHWFYQNLYWHPFAMSDSLALDDAVLGGKEVVVTDGGRFEVNLKERKRSSVYWSSGSNLIRRCSWFYKNPNNAEANLLPFDESTAELMESEYEKAISHNSWNHRVALPNSDKFLLIKDANTIEFHDMGQALVVKRGVDEFVIDDGEEASIDHLIVSVSSFGDKIDDSGE